MSGCETIGVAGDGFAPGMVADFHQQFERFSALGATSGGGLCRLTGSTDDGRARRLLADEFALRGAALTVDRIGNMFGTFMFAPESAGVVLVGSHLDSVPTGGRFDGNYGVVAALVAATVIAARTRTDPTPVKRNLAVVNWTNEEGSRFLPSLMGSSVFVGSLSADEALEIRDPDGVSLGSALQAIGFSGQGELGLAPVRYLEIHNEQGDRLERAGADIGVVHGVWAVRKLCLRFSGEPSHVGPTPMAQRRDALHCAAKAITLLHEMTAAEDGEFFASAARIEVLPNSPNVVASQARIWLDFRHAQPERIERFGAAFLAGVRAFCAGVGVEVEAETDSLRGTSVFDASGIALIREVVNDLGFPFLDVATIAGHDAVALQRLVPSNLVFVPSRDGLSHNEREHTERTHLERGVAVVAETLWRMLTLD